MAQYLLSVWHDDEYEVDFSSDEIQHVVAQVSAYNQQLEQAGAWVFGNGLMPASTATVARFDAGEVTVTDGPYAESKEQVGGFWVIEAESPDAARQWAVKASAACEGPVEVRPFQSE